jgi:hypothetical protein
LLRAAGALLNLLQNFDDFHPLLFGRGIPSRIPALIKMVTQGNQIEWLIIGCVPINWIVRAKRAENSIGSTSYMSNSPNTIRRPVQPAANPIALSRVNAEKVIEQDAEQ